jgi:hypothetical protein
MCAEALNQVFLGQVTATQAIADRSVQVTGDSGALARFQEVFPPPDIRVVAEQSGPTTRLNARKQGET